MERARDQRKGKEEYLAASFTVGNWKRRSDVRWKAVPYTGTGAENARPPSSELLSPARRTWNSIFNSRGLTAVESPQD